MPKDLNRPLPVANPPVDRHEIVFSHPSEEEFARVLDYYAVRWRYEPVTFPLRWDEDGNILEAFSPDFYLVEQDLFVELTTLRPHLMRLKNRKVLSLRQLFPEVSIKLWTRADFLHLLERFGLQDETDSLVGGSAVETVGGHEE